MIKIINTIFNKTKNKRALFILLPLFSILNYCIGNDTIRLIMIVGEMILLVYLHHKYYKQLWLVIVILLFGWLSLEEHFFLVKEKVEKIMFVGHFKTIAFVNSVSRDMSKDYVIKLSNKGITYTSHLFRFSYGKIKPFPKLGDTVLLRYSLDEEPLIRIVSWHPTTDTIIKYSHPVLFRNGEEIGNKYFYYAKLFPERVFNHFGYEILYKSVPVNVSPTDSTVVLQLKDLQGHDKQLKYRLSNLSSIPDTFLVFKNINDSISTHYTVCTPEINTPTNWAKIDGYGYLFGYDEVYSKQEIESQCPRIREYVEQYKKQMSDNNTNTTESTAQEPE